MQVLDLHAGFLSNNEVLALLQEDVRLQDDAIRRFKKEHTRPRVRPGQQQQPESGKPYFDYQAAIQAIVPENVRTLQLEMLKYLQQADLPCTRVGKKAMRNILRELKAIQPLPEPPDARGDYGLTKTEKLMLINLAPCQAVELSVIIDELEMRFSEEAQEQLLAIFTRHLANAKSTRTNVDAATAAVKEEDEDIDMAAEAAESVRRETEEDAYEHAEDLYDMPEEENDLVDEGMADGGRETDMRELDEVGES